MLHADDELPILFLCPIVDVLKELAIVDFTGSRFFAPRIISSLKIPDFIPAHVDVRDQIAFGDLLT